MKRAVCQRCGALLEPDFELVHRDWHIRLERAIKGIPEPPPVERPL